MIINNKRALAYSEQIAWVKPIEKADNIELIGINGWTCIAKKGEFKEGDLCVFFEVDSKLPETEDWAQFLSHRNFKIKTMKLNKFGVVSQGLAMPYKDFPNVNLPFVKGVDLTEELKVTYAKDSDRSRKTNIDDKYKAIEKKHPVFFKTKLARFLMKTNWGRNIISCIFTTKEIKRETSHGWPTYFKYVHKTDQERVENMLWILDIKGPWAKTLKIDGTSSTYILEKKPFGKYEYFVLSRNVRQTDENMANFHSDKENVYWQVSNKYKIKEFLMDYLTKNNLKYVAIQGETCGCSLGGIEIQGDPHKLKDLRFYAFDLIRSDTGVVEVTEGREICKSYGIDWVPIVDDNYILPKDFEQFKLDADGSCDIPGSSGLREGWVYRKIGQPDFSFKNISKEYLLKH